MQLTSPSIFCRKRYRPQTMNWTAAFLELVNDTICCVCVASAHFYFQGCQNNIPKDFVKSHFNALTLTLLSQS